MTEKNKPEITLQHRNIKCNTNKGKCITLNDLGAFNIYTYDYSTGEELQDPIG